MEWVSIVPFIVVIIIAMVTRQVLPGLTLGLIIASFIHTPHVIGGFETFVSYIVEGLVDENNIKIIVFLYLFAGVIGMIKISGGIKGFVESASKKITTKRGALFLTWISTLGTFSAPSFRIVTIAPIMRALLKKVKMTAQELGFVIETTASPIIVLIPIATAFVGYMTSIVELALHNEGIQMDAYSLYIQSIPYNFFSFAIIILGIYLSFFHHAKKPATDAGNPEGEIDDHWEDCHPAVSKELPSKPWNLIIPLFVVISLTLFLTYWDGAQKGYSFFLAFIQANVLDAMVIALIVTVFFMVVFLVLQKIRLRDIIGNFTEGANTMMPVILLLAIVWGLATSTEELGFSVFVTEHISWVPAMFVPPVLFLLGSFISYFIGSAWGTWGILMPLGISFATVSGTPLPIVVGAVFASGTFGSFASPLSDDTNTMANILNLKVMAYARFKLKPALLAAGVALILYAIVPFFLF